MLTKPEDEQLCSMDKVVSVSQTAPSGRACGSCCGAKELLWAQYDWLSNANSPTPPHPRLSPETTISLPSAWTRLSSVAPL